MKKKLIILSTGGTIEKVYDESDGSLDNKESKLTIRVLSKLRLPYTHIELVTVMNKDSLKMDDSDREVICQAIAKEMQKGCPMVVLHGTDTMSVTAEYCFKKIGAMSVSVVFTGAMKPAELEDSDAKQNVCEAIIAAKILPPGFYISFHNEIFNVPHVRKNRKIGTFEHC